MTIYRTEKGHAEVRDFATRLIDQWQIAHEVSELTGPLGPTHVLSAGKGPPLVLLAGTNFCAATSLHLIEMLARTHHVHAVDLPGQPGLSHHERPRRTHVAYGAWLADLLPKIADTPPVLVGHSLGAKVALSGLAAGADTAGTVLVDPAGLTWLNVTASIMRPTIPWLRHPGPNTSDALLQMMMAPGHRPCSDVTTWTTLVGRHVRTSLAPRPLSKRTIRGQHGRVTVVTGAHDAFLSARRLSRAVSSKLPTAQFRLIPDAGHMLPHERPDAITAAVIEMSANDDRRSR